MANGNEPKITSRMVALTPTELYLQRVKSTYDGLRKSAKGFDYIPPSFGGIFGQQALTNMPSTLEIIDFEAE